MYVYGSICPYRRPFSKRHGLLGATGPTGATGLTGPVGPASASGVVGHGDLPDLLKPYACRERHGTIDMDMHYRINAFMEVGTMISVCPFRDGSCFFLICMAMCVAHHIGESNCKELFFVIPFLMQKGNLSSNLYLVVSTCIDKVLEAPRFIEGASTKLTWIPALIFSATAIEHRRSLNSSEFWTEGLVVFHSFVDLAYTNQDLEKCAEELEAARASPSPNQTSKDARVEIAKLQAELVTQLELLQ
ncbi:hypothetical protein ZIOFF_071846 [Zingiber officinale]|uniref:Uncharacterized protein n=1 Tax=Zingiber officinale TaxID=94328 RepID=A0A8J5C234_ZINOF|nr:hypothetical protein ZIOFF_071846 [Zingiber officinale]